MSPTARIKFSQLIKIRSRSILKKAKVKEALKVQKQSRSLNRQLKKVSTKTFDWSASVKRVTND